MNKFAVILADPAWQYGNRGCRGGTDAQYETMSTADICKLRVKEIAADDAVLLLWTTWPFMQEAFKVIDAWGFNYLTGLPWIKVQKAETDLWCEWHLKTQMGVGFWVRGVSEPILICRRGNAKAPDKCFVGLLSPNIRHSRKPENIYEYAEALPGPYLELFARRPRKGWSVFGNQVENSITL